MKFLGMHYSIHQGDNLDILPGLLDDSVDAVITDPPYGTLEEGKCKINGYRNMGPGVSNWSDFGEEWDREMPLSWIPVAASKLRPGGSWLIFCDGKRPGEVWDALEKAGQHPLQNVYWVKTNPPTNCRKNFRSAVEVAVFARKPGRIIHWGGGGITKNIFTYPTVPACHRRHRTEKPVRLMCDLVRLLCPPGGTVLDPFMGVASTGIAAGLLGRTFVGVELDAEYFGMAEERLRNGDRKYKRKKVVVRDQMVFIEDAA